MIYYIDNSISKEREETFRKNNIEHFLPSEIDIEQLNDQDGLIVNCEIDIDVKNKNVDRSSFYGIKFVQDLRLKGFKGKVLFCSFLSRERLLSQNPTYQIVNFSGHSFLQFPASMSNLCKEIQKIETLDDLALMDCKYHFCSLDGYIKEELHSLKNITNKDEFENYGLSIISNIEESLSKNLNDIKRNFSKRNLQDKYSYIEQELLKLVNIKETKNDGDVIKPKWKWEILWLDDEIESNNLLRRSLEKLDIKVHLKRNYKEAMEVWNSDFHLNNISLVIADYRLKSNNIVGGKQGYQFLSDIGKSGQGVSLIAYSALPRRFLLDSLKYYGMLIHSFSKFDFNVSKEEDCKYLIDNLIYLGDSHWEQLHNQPSGAKWNDWKSAYYQFKNSISYHSYDAMVSKIAKDCVNDFSNFFDLNKNPDFTKENLYFHYSLPTKFEFKLNQNFSPKDGFDEIHIKQILLTRRILLSIYAYLKKGDFNNIFFAESEYFDIVKLIARTGRIGKEKDKGIKWEDFKTIDEVIDNKVKSDSTKQGLGYLALLMDTTWPFGLLPEERAWLVSNDLLEKYFVKNLDQSYHFIKKVNIKIQEVFNNTDFKNLLLKTEFEGYSSLKLKKGEFDLYFTNDFYPCIKQIPEIKFLLLEMVSCFDKSSNNKKVEYSKSNLGEFISLWRYIYKLSMSTNLFETQENSNVLSLDRIRNKEQESLIHFLNNIRTKYSNKIFTEINKIKFDFINRISSNDMKMFFNGLHSILKHYETIIAIEDKDKQLLEKNISGLSRLKKNTFKSIESKTLTILINKFLKTIEKEIEDNYYLEDKRNVVADKINKLLKDKKDENKDLKKLINEFFSEYNIENNTLTIEDEYMYKFKPNQYLFNKRIRINTGMNEFENILEKESITKDDLGYIFDRDNLTALLIEINNEQIKNEDKFSLIHDFRNEIKLRNQSKGKEIGLINNDTESKKELFENLSTTMEGDKNEINENEYQGEYNLLEFLYTPSKEYETEVIEHLFYNTILPKRLRKEFTANSCFVNIDKKGDVFKTNTIMIILSNIQVEKLNDDLEGINIREIKEYVIVGLDPKLIGESIKKYKELKKASL